MQGFLGRARLGGRLQFDYDTHRDAHTCPRAVFGIASTWEKTGIQPLHRAPPKEPPAIMEHAADLAGAIQLSTRAVTQPRDESHAPVTRV